MAGRGRGGGRMRPRNLEEEWGGWGGGAQYPSNPYPHQPPFYQQPLMPSPHFGYYSGQPPFNPASQSIQNQGNGGFGQPRPRGRIQGGRGRFNYQQAPQINQQQQKVGEEKRDQGKKEEERMQNKIEPTRAADKFPQVVCFKCGEPGHFKCGEWRDMGELLRKTCRAVTELDNSVPREQEGGFDDIHSKIKAACTNARGYAMKASRWDGELLKFLAKNATNWDLEVLPTEVQAWISQEKDMEAAQKTGKWIDLKMLI